MAFHLFRTSRVARELAAGGVSPREPAGYLISSFLAWTVPFYLYLIVSPLAAPMPAPIFSWTFRAWMRRLR